MAETMPRELGSFIKLHESNPIGNKYLLSRRLHFLQLFPGLPKPPQTSVPTTLRRSSRRISLLQGLKPFPSLKKWVKVLENSSTLASNGEQLNPRKAETRSTPKREKIVEATKKRKRKDCREERNSRVVVTRSKAKLGNGKVENLKKRRVYYKKVVYDEGQFELGDDVYVKRREDAGSDGEELELEECRICFKAGRSIMIECEDCLGGFHLKFLKPPLKEVPEGEWICEFCAARKLGKEIELPTPQKGRNFLGQ